MIRDKIKMVIKRYSDILTQMKNGREGKIYLRKYREWICIDEEVKVIIEIIEEIVERETLVWMKTFYREILKGYSDIKILIDIPVERGKYYQIKKSFFNKIYECCIFKGLVRYEEILEYDIG